MSKKPVKNSAAKENSRNQTRMEQLVAQLDQVISKKDTPNKKSEKK